MARILIADDEKNVRATVARALVLEGHETGEAADGDAALTRLSEGGFDLAVVDLSMPHLDGLALLEELRSRGDATPVIILTAHGTVERAVRALKLGADDFLEKPPDRERLLHAVTRALERTRLLREVEDLRRDVPGPEGMIGSGPLMDELRDKIRLAASSDARILITGENGTGKELVARAVHAASPRCERPFVKVNCAAVPETLFESELFGHVKGAFTDARENRRGRFEAAHTGTLFLDEVAEIPPHLQAKLLRVIETGEMQRVGGKEEFKVDVRIVAATNRPLEKDVEAGRFRQDLYYRLDVVRLHVPPLRRRKQDIAALAARFLADCCSRNGFADKTLATDALERLQLHDWPGNVRELRNAVERLAILTPATTITAADAARLLPAAGAALAAGAGDPDATLKERVEAYERAAIAAALARHGGSMTETARALGLERSHLYKKMRALGLKRAGSS